LAEGASTCGQISIDATRCTHPKFIRDSSTRAFLTASWRICALREGQTPREAGAQKPKGGLSIEMAGSLNRAVGYVESTWR